jgi:putative transposase
MLRAVKVRLYPTESQKQHLAQAFGCVRWVWNQSVVTMSQTYKDTGKGISALAMKKQLPVWKKEYEWLKTCYSQCLQQSVLNLSQAFINFFDGRAGYPTFKNRQGRQSLQYPQNVKVVSDSEIKFPGLLGTVKAKIHRDITGEIKTVTLSKMPDDRYYASLLVEDSRVQPNTSSDSEAKPCLRASGKAIGIDLGLIVRIVG